MVAIKPRIGGRANKSYALTSARKEPGVVSLRRFVDSAYARTYPLTESYNDNLYFQHIENCVVSNIYYDSVAEISNPINALSNRLFKKGISIIKSPESRRSYSEEGKIDQSNRKDRDIQHALFSKFLNKANSAERRLEDELRAWYLDLNVTDSAYMYLNFDYQGVVYNQENGKLVGSKLVAIERLNPLCIQKPVDKNGTSGQSYLSCVIHRTMVKWTDEIDEIIGSGKDVFCKDYITNKDPEDVSDPKKDMSEACDLPLYPVSYVYNSRLSSLAFNDLQYLSGSNFDSDRLYPLFSKEVVSSQKKDPRGLYGRSVILKLRRKVDIMVGLDRFGQNIFNNPKHPYNIITVNTMREAAAEMKAEAIRQAQDDSDAPVWVDAVPAVPGQKVLELTNIPSKLQDIKYTEYRNAIAKDIAASFGVTHDFVNAAETVGGTVSQNVQLQVTTEVVESDLRLVSRILNRITEELHAGLGDKPYYCYTIFPPDDKAETVKMASQLQRFNMVQIASALGFKVITDGEDCNIDDVNFIVVPGSNRLGEMTLTTQQMQLLQLIAGVEMAGEETPPEITECFG